MKTKKPIIWCIVGPSCSGKTTLANRLREKHGWNVLCSYTTRPMRDGEMNSVDHYFISEKMYMSMKTASDKSKAERNKLGIPATHETMKHEMLAYVNFGGYAYFTTHNQISEDVINAYVIDEKGLADMAGNFGKIYDIRTLFIICSPEDLRRHGVSEDRIRRDVGRNFMNLSVGSTITNSGSLDSFLSEADRWAERHK